MNVGTTTLKKIAKKTINRILKVISHMDIWFAWKERVIMCGYCENGKNLFLTRNSFNIDKSDKSEMIIKNPKSRIVEIASQDSFSLYDKPTRTIRRIAINYCPMCGRKLEGENATTEQ